MEKIYNKKEIEGIKTTCKLVNGLIYSFSYSVDLFKITPDEKDNIRVDFRIKKFEKFSGKIYTLYQTGHVYISSKGKIYYYNFLGNKKTFTNFGPVVSRFLETHEEP